VDLGVSVAFIFFALAMLVVICGELLGSLIELVKRLLG
jgi:hypothetical protein